MTYEKIRERYLKNYITDTQLVRFKELGVITQEQYDALYAEKHEGLTDDQQFIDSLLSEVQND